MKGRVIEMKVITTTYKNNQKETTVKEYQAIREEKHVEMQVVNLYPEFEYQTILGFGGAITESAGHAYSKLSKENQEKILDLYFGKDGIQYNLTRTHLDSCDFSLDNYSAMTDPEDKEMKSFTLDRDEKYILPLLKAAEAKKGEPLDILLSPWSPPAFMKTNGEKNHGGKLKPEYREFWAEYICRYIQEYEKRGFKVNRFTIQNEPIAVQIWDSCIWSAEDEKVFVRDFLYPAFEKHGIDVKINIWDHNKERVYERARDIIDQDTDKMIDGIAFHWYSGDHFEGLTLAREAFPGKQLLHSEGCVEYSRFSTNQLDNAQMYAHDIMGNLNGGMTGYYDWNIYLDEIGGPNHVKNYCAAPIMIDTKNDTYQINLSYDYIGHFSKYIKKGAKRIGFTKYSDKLEMTAFKNPDGSIVMVYLNRTETDIPVTIRYNGDLISFNVEGSTISTAIL